MMGDYFFMEFFEMNVKCKCNQIIIVEGSKLYFADNEKNKWKMILFHHNHKAIYHQK